MNLLNDKVISVRLTDGRNEVLNLPAVLERLCHDKILCFPHLMAHQRQAWYCFLVQVAALAALPERGTRSLRAESDWREALLRLSGNGHGDAPWTLVVDDTRQPAFMQPPAPTRDLQEFQGPLYFPDDLDILVTSKSHDVKMNRIRRPDLDHWIFALVVLQTMHGYLGSGKYGISRMKGGHGSRPFVGLAPCISWGGRFLRDLAVLLKTHDSVAATHDFKVEGGKKLLWLYPWDEESSLDPSDLDPYYIEVCRRVRLRLVDGRVAGYTKPTRTTRVAADELRGNLGDPWIPVERLSGAALTLSRKGFSYERLQEVLFSSTYLPGAAQKVHDSDSESGLTLIAMGLARGQGETQGLHERVVPIPHDARLLISLDEHRDHIAQRSKERVENAAALAKKALRPALAALLQGGSENLDLRNPRLRCWMELFDRRIDEIFFSHLWRTLSLDDEKARKTWQQEIASKAREILREAIDSLPVPGARRYGAISRAEYLLDRGIYKCFPILRARKDDA
jgi:CRISPR system Cascade subunit CasA